MFTFIQKRQKTLFFRAGGIISVFCFLSLSLFSNPGFAQIALSLPAPGVMIAPTPGFIPPMLKGLKIDPENPLRFDFIVDTGNSDLKGDALKEESAKLIKYFLASLTTPEDDMWVNLSPYEKDRIIPESFSQTDMGRDLLAEDYILKQFTASLMYPEEELGREFWDRVYKKAHEKYGTTELAFNTFNKVWIVPDKAVIYEKEDRAFVVESKLKVMMEKDYLAMQHADEVLEPQSQGSESQVQDAISSEIIKELILPEIEKEVNEGKNFTNLRQIYNSLILAAWFKHTLKESLLGKIYVDQNKIKGIDLKDKTQKEKIYKQYVEAFKKGVYNYIKKDYDKNSRKIVKRKYFSGGVQLKLAFGRRPGDSAMATTLELPIIETTQDSRRVKPDGDIILVSAETDVELQDGKMARRTFLQKLGLATAGVLTAGTAATQESKAGTKLTPARELQKLDLAGQQKLVARATRLMYFEEESELAVKELEMARRVNRINNPQWDDNNPVFNQTLAMAHVQAGTATPEMKAIAKQFDDSYLSQVEKQINSFLKSDYEYSDLNNASTFLFIKDDENRSSDGNRIFRENQRFKTLRAKIDLAKAEMNEGFFFGEPDQHIRWALKYDPELVRSRLSTERIKLAETGRNRGTNRFLSIVGSALGIGAGAAATHAVRNSNWLKNWRSNQLIKRVVEEGKGLKALLRHRFSKNFGYGRIRDKMAQKIDEVLIEAFTKQTISAESRIKEIRESLPYLKTSGALPILSAIAKSGILENPRAKPLRNRIMDVLAEMTDRYKWRVMVSLPHNEISREVMVSMFKKEREENVGANNLSISRLILRSTKENMEEKIFYDERHYEEASDLIASVGEEAVQELSAAMHKRDAYGGIGGTEKALHKVIEMSFAKIGTPHAVRMYFLRYNGEELAKHAVPETFETVMHFVEDKKIDGKLRLNALEALGYFGQSQAHKTVPAIEKAFDDQSYDARGYGETSNEGIYSERHYRAFLALVNIGTPEALRILKERGLFVPDRDINEVYERDALIALTQANPDKLEPLVPDLINLIPLTTNTGLVYKSLGRSKDERALPHLLSAIEDGHNFRNGMEALEEYGDVHVLTELAKTSEAPTRNTQEARIRPGQASIDAISALDKVAKKEDAPLFLDIARHTLTDGRFPERRVMAIDGYLKRATSEQIAELSDADKNILRKNALGGLGEFREYSHDQLAVLFPDTFEAAPEAMEYLLGEEGIIRRDSTRDSTFARSSLERMFDDSHEAGVVAQNFYEMMKTNSGLKDRHPGWPNTALAIWAYLKQRPAEDKGIEPAEVFRRSFENTVHSIVDFVDRHQNWKDLYQHSEIVLHMASASSEQRSRFIEVLKGLEDAHGPFVERALHEIIVVERVEDLLDFTRMLPDKIFKLEGLRVAIDQTISDMEKESPHLQTGHIDVVKMTLMLNETLKKDVSDDKRNMYIQAAVGFSSLMSPEEVHLRSFLDAVSRDTINEPVLLPAFNEAIKKSKGWRENFIKRIFEKERNVYAVLKNAAITHFSAQQLARGLQINIKLARYLKKKGKVWLFEKLKHPEFRNIINEIAYNLNREQTLHPAEFRVGEDEKESLFDFLFDLEDIHKAKEIFDTYFRNNPESYIIPLSRLAQLLEYISLDQVKNIVRAVRENPKESLDEIAAAIKESIGDVEGAQYILREMQWILSNLFVLQDRVQLIDPLVSSLKDAGKTSKDLIDVLKAIDKEKNFTGLQKIAEENGLNIIDVLKLKLESISLVGREDLIIGGLQSVNDLPEDQQDKIYQELSAEFEYLPTESKRRVYFKILFEQDTDNTRIITTLNELNADAEVSAKNIPEHIKLFLKRRRNFITESTYLLDYLAKSDELQAKHKKEALKQLRKLYAQRSYAKKKLKDKAFDDIRATIGELETRISLGEPSQQIPHIYFEPLLKIYFDYMKKIVMPYEEHEDSLKTFRNLIQTMNGNKSMHDQLATLKRRLYEKLVEFSNLNYHDKPNTLTFLIEVLVNELGPPSDGNIQELYEQIILHMDRFIKIIDNYKKAQANRFSEQLNEKFMELGGAILYDLTHNQKLNEDSIQQFMDILAEIGSEKLIAGFKRVLRDELDNEEEILLKLKSYMKDNERFQWKDYQQRNIYDLIDIFLRTIDHSEIHENILNALLAEIDGKFQEERYQSDDYKRTLDEIIDIEVEKFSDEQKRKFQEAIESVEEETEYTHERLQKIEGFGQLKARIAKIRNWEKNLDEIVDDELTGEFTDDFYVLFNIGNYRGSTACQSCTYGSSLNHGLTGYTVNGTNKAVAVLNEERQVANTRRIVRLKTFEDENGNRFPGIFVEESTQFGSENIDVLYEILDKVAAETGLPIIKSTYRPAISEDVQEGESKRLKITTFRGRSSYDYSDSYGGSINPESYNEDDRFESDLLSVLMKPAPAVSSLADGQRPKADHAMAAEKEARWKRIREKYDAEFKRYVGSMDTQKHSESMVDQVTQDIIERAHLKNVQENKVFVQAVDGNQASLKSTTAQNIASKINATGKKAVVIQRDWFLFGSEQRRQAHIADLDQNEISFDDYSDQYFRRKKFERDVLQKIQEFNNNPQQDKLVLDLKELYGRDNGPDTTYSKTIEIDRSTIIIIEGINLLRKSWREFYDGTLLNLVNPYQSLQMRLRRPTNINVEAVTDIHWRSNVPSFMKYLQEEITRPDLILIVDKAMLEKSDDIEQRATPDPAMAAQINWKEKLGALSATELHAMIRQGSSSRQGTHLRKLRRPNDLLIGGVILLRKVGGRWSMLLGKRQADGYYDVPGGKVMDHEISRDFESADEIQEMVHLNFLSETDVDPEGQTETVAGGVVRELWEETGIKIRVSDIAGRILDNYYSKPGVMASVFIYVDSQEEAFVKETAELGNYQWVPFDIILDSSRDRIGRRVETFLQQSDPNARLMEGLDSREGLKIAQATLHKYLSSLRRDDQTPSDHAMAVERVPGPGDGVMLAPYAGPGIDLSEVDKDERRLFQEIMENTLLKKPQSALLYNILRVQENYFYEDNNAPWMERHTRRGTIISAYLANYLNLSPEDIDAITIASGWHDIGKTEVPIHVLTKPGKLTDREYETIKGHLTEGVKILEEFYEKHRDEFLADGITDEFMKKVIDIVRTHHENLAGTGYLGKKREDYPNIIYHILPVVDAFEAMTGHRPYRTPMAPDEALERLEKENEDDKLYDPLVLKALRDNMPLITTAFFAEYHMSTKSDSVELILGDKTADDREATLADHAMASEAKTPGGIDFNPNLIDLEIKGEGGGFIAPPSLQELEMMPIEGLVPVIINITPVTNLPLLLGAEEESADDTLELSYAGK